MTKGGVRIGGVVRYLPDPESPRDGQPGAYFIDNVLLVWYNYNKIAIQQDRKQVKRHGRKHKHKRVFRSVIFRTS